MSFDWKHLDTLDRLVVGSAGVALVASFLPWWGVTVGPLSVTVSAWSAGFTAWAGTLLLVVAGLLLLRRASVSLLPGKAGPSALIAGIAALGLLLVVIRWLTLPRYRGVDVGARYGIYVALLAGLVEVTAAVLKLRAGLETASRTEN
ncbi:MAG TPA: hypothetical protein VE985_10805 [Gaiellaceae bacterium]|nr:hypothetical protein [Gaiellaceae bacterium]